MLSKSEIFILLGGAFIMSLFVACAPEDPSQWVSETSVYSISDPDNVRFHLTDKPLDNASGVYVNVAYMEVMIDDSQGVPYRLILAENFGLVNLLELRDNVLKALGDLTLPAGTTVRKLRLVLDGSDNHVLFNDDSRCEMATPSATQSGVKIVLKQPITIEEGYKYAFVLDFDAEKSVVVRGNGDCLLKPVIKLISASRAPIVEDDSELDGEGSDQGGSVDESAEEELVDGSDSNEESFDDGPEDSPVVDEGDIRY